jgi:hypothetical protein
MQRLQPGVGGSHHSVLWFFIAYKSLAFPPGFFLPKFLFQIVLDWLGRIVL